MKRTTIIVSLALILMLAGIPALAATVSTTSATTTEAKPNPGISFNQAISLAKAAAPGYRLMELSLDDEDGQLIYEAELIRLTDSSKIEIILDAATGELIPNTPDDEDDEDKNENLEDAVLLAKAVITFEQANDYVLKANAGAMITEIELEEENGLLVYKVEFFSANGQETEVMVDAVTGAIIPVNNQSDGQSDNQSDDQSDDLSDNQTDNQTNDQTEGK